MRLSEIAILGQAPMEFMAGYSPGNDLRYPTLNK